MNANELRTAIEKTAARSAWARGVKAYAFDLLDELDEAIKYGYFDENDMESPKLLMNCLLNGASTWDMYSWAGCSLVYDGDIAKRLCNPTELKRTKYGKLRPNKSELWLDTQARALHQASGLILRTLAHDNKR